MYKKILLVTTIITTSSQTIADNLYLKLAANMNFPLNNQFTINQTNIDLKTENYFGGSGALGYKITDNISIEAGIDYINAIKYKSDVPSGKLNNNSPTVKMDIIVPKISLFYNHNLNETIGFYVGGGIGATIPSSLQLHLHEQDEKKIKPTSETTFYGSGDIGMMFHMKQISFDIGYSFGYYGKVYKELKDDTIIHTAKVGIRYHF
jgi:hypothetical protein